MAQSFNLSSTGSLSWNAANTNITALAGGSLNISAGTSIYFDTAGSNGMMITADGNVGIDNTDPDQKLVVNGDLRLPQTYAADGIGKKLLFHSATGFGIAGINYVGGPVGIEQAGSYLNFFTNNNNRMAILQGGNVGIGTNNPVKKLHVKVDGINNPLFENNGANNTDAWATLTALNVDNSILGPASYGGYLYFYYRYHNGVTSGNNTGFKINVSGISGTFTGKHQSYSKNTSILQNTTLQNYVGLIVSSQGEYITYKDNSRTEDINIDDTWPIFDLSNSNNDKKVYGIISNYISCSVKEKDYSDDGFSNGLDGRIRINSVGEGAIWLCNKNGIIENGDYITSTTVTGYGTKQSDDLLHNYTVAKITCDCDFSLTKVVKKQIKLVDNPTGKVISFDSQGNMEYENDLDPDGNIQMVYQYQTRFLQADGTLLLDEADYLARLNNGETVFISCFVGCTYHCG